MYRGSNRSQSRFMIDASISDIRPMLAPRSEWGIEDKEADLFITCFVFIVCTTHTGIWIPAQVLADFLNLQIFLFIKLNNLKWLTY